MSTVDKKLADLIVKGNGYYEDDPRVVRIYKYTSAWGTERYKLFYQMQTLFPSEYVINPELYWTALREKSIMVDNTCIKL
jgi:hypothetical protein